MANFTGTLNVNELYNALNNMIISQRIFDIKIEEPTLADMLKVDGTLYGDTKLYYSLDVGPTYEWQNDLEAPNLLSINRNNTVKVESVTLDKFRQANITIDSHLTKRAWSTEGAFSQFNGILTSSISQAKAIFENGYINTYIGTHKQNLPKSIQNVDVSDLTAAKNAVEQESLNRIVGQRAAAKIEQIFIDLKKNSRDYNEYGHIRSYNKSDFIIVWNSLFKSSILNIDLPTVYNNQDIKSKFQGVDLDFSYFGNEATISTATAYTYSLTEQLINGVHYWPGEKIATGATVTGAKVYNADPTILCKIISKEGNPFLSSFEVGTSFYNPRSLTENHYLTWGYNTMVSLKEFPFITVIIDLEDMIQPE
jgi:hypothetical protein